MNSLEFTLTAGNTILVSALMNRVLVRWGEDRLDGVRLSAVIQRGRDALRGSKIGVAQLDIPVPDHVNLRRSVIVYGDARTGDMSLMLAEDLDA